MNNPLIETEYLGGVFPEDEEFEGVHSISINVEGGMFNFQADEEEIDHLINELQEALDSGKK